MAATQQENSHEEDVASELCGDQESAIVLGRSSGRRVGSRNVVASFSTDPTSSVSSTCSPSCPSGRPLQGTRSPIRKASLFEGGRKRDSEEIILLKMADLGGGRHPVRAVRSTQLTRRVFWADPLNSLLGPGRSGIS